MHHQFSRKRVNSPRKEKGTRRLRETMVLTRDDKTILHFFEGSYQVSLDIVNGRRTIEKV